MSSPSTDTRSQVAESTVDTAAETDVIDKTASWVSQAGDGDVSVVAGYNSSVMRACPLVRTTDVSVGFSNQRLLNSIDSENPIEPSR